MHMHMDAGHDGGGCLRVVPLHIHLCAGPSAGLAVHHSLVSQGGTHVGLPTVRCVRYMFRVRPVGHKRQGSSGSEAGTPRTVYAWGHGGGGAASHTVEATVV